MAEAKFKGSEFIRAAKSTDKDILSVVLCADKEYTQKDVQQLISKFLSKEAK